MYETLGGLKYIVKMYRTYKRFQFAKQPISIYESEVILHKQIDFDKLLSTTDKISRVI